MIVKKTLISALLLSSFAISSIALAFDRDHATTHSGGHRSRSTGGEMNNDRDFRDSQIDSRTQTGNGFKLSEIESGSPTPHDRIFFNYMYYNDMTRNHR